MLPKACTLIVPVRTCGQRARAVASIQRASRPTRFLPPRHVAVRFTHSERETRASEHDKLRDGPERRQQQPASSPQEPPRRKKYVEPPGSPQQSILACVLAISIIASFSIWDAYAEEPPSISPPAPPPPREPHSSTSSTLPLSASLPPKYDTSESNLSGAYDELVALLGPTRVDTDPDSLISHSSTEWSRAPHGALDRPSMVACPRTTAEVSAIARICHRRRIPMIAFSGGTSLEGTLAALNREVCVDFSLMDQVLSLRPDDMDVSVQPGVPYQELNRQLERHGLFFPPDPGPGAQIGGMVAQGCSGTNAYRYGAMKDWVLGLELVLADGSVVTTRRRPRKSSSGYDLTRLVVGSEGTLAFVTRAELKLARRPRNVQVAVVAFPSVAGAVAAAVKILQGGHQLEAMELIDETFMRAVNEAGPPRRRRRQQRRWREAPTLFLKLAGPPATVRELAAAVRRIAEGEGASDFAVAGDEAESEELWQVRKTCLFSLLAVKEEGMEFLSADACVPVSRLADIIPFFQRRLRESGLFGACLGHVGDGNIHAAVLFHPRDRAKGEAVVREVQRASIAMDGTVSGEHGIGLSFRDAVPEELGDGAVDLMRKIKFAVDPLGLMNPGKMFYLSGADRERA